MLNFDINSDSFNPGYAIEDEDKEFLEQSSTAPLFRAMGDVPERIDPRKTALYLENWLKMENQYSQGSCQGQALSEMGEYAWGIESNKVIQLSRQYCYIRSQMFDNIRGDRGSTLSGGTKCSKEGMCLESIAPYQGSNYPGWNYVTDARKQAATYKLESHTYIKSEEEVKLYIGSGLGIVQIGISWGRSMNPDSRGCVKSFGGGSGGHSVVFCGYVPDSDVGATSSKGYWYLLKNSWGAWGPLKGFAYVDPRAVSQMLSHRFTVMIGRSDMGAPSPRPVPVDFTKPGNSING